MHMKSERTWWRAFLAGTILLSSLPSDAAVGVGSLEELFMMEIPPVITASKKEESVNEAPNTMYVFTSDEIRRRGFRKMEDLLSIVPGMGVFHRDLQLVGQVRGVAPNDNEKIAIMIDGQIINNLTQPEIMSGPVNFDAVERVEVIVGPGSVLYGPETLLAIVNLITRRTEGHTATVSVGDDGLRSQSGTLSLGQRWEENKYLSFTGTYVEKEGFSNEMSSSWPRPDDTSYKPRGAGKLAPSFYFNGLGRFDDWTLQALSVNSQLLHLNAAQDAGVDRRRFDYVNSLTINKEERWSDSLTGAFRFSYGTKRQVWGTVDFPAGTSVGSLKIGDPYDYDMSQAVYNAEYALQHKTDKNFLQGGVQYAHKQHRHNYIAFFNPDDNAAADTDIAQIVDHVNTNILGGYLSEEFRVTDKLKLVGAVRADRDSSLRSNRHKVYASPRAAVVYAASRDWTTKLMYNTATRMPAPWNGPLNTIWGNDKPQVNPNFQGAFGGVNPTAEKPEVLRAVEWQNILQGARSRVSVNVYYQKLDDYITWFNPFTNAGDFEGQGVEADASYKPRNTLKLRAGGGYVKTQIRNPLPANPFSAHHAVNDKKEMLAAPQVMANAGFDWNIIRPLFLSATVRYFTKQPFGYQNAGDPAPTYGYFYNRAYLDAALTWESLFERANVQLAGRNLTDDRRAAAAPQQRQTYTPRGVETSLTVSVKF